MLMEVWYLPAKESDWPLLSLSATAEIWGVVFSVGRGAGPGSVRRNRRSL